MKLKLLNIALLLCACIFNFNELLPTKVLADSEVLDSTMEITNSTEFDGQTFTLNNMECGFKISSGATVKFSNCVFEGSSALEYTDITDLFIVESDSKLILENITFSDTKELNIKTCVKNDGIVEITNVDFIGENSIYNSSRCENSILFHGGKLPNVFINFGYITVFEHTNIVGTCQIALDNYSDITDTSLQKLVVSGYGENVYASKLIDSFILNSTDSELKLDFVGDNVDTEIYNSYFDSQERISDGDILVTKNNIGMNLDGKQISYASTNCTASSYIENELNSKKYFLYSMLGTTNYLDNFSAITKNGLKYTKDADTSPISIIVTSSFGNSSSTQSIQYLCKSSKAIFIDIPAGFTFDSINYEDNADSIISLTNIKSNSCYFRTTINYISPDICYDDIKITINLKPIVKDASLKITKSDDINVQYESLVVGKATTFKIPLNHKQLATKVLFNSIEIGLTKTSEFYSFSAMISEGENTLEIVSVSLPISINVTIDTQTFHFGDDIKISKSVSVTDTNDVVNVIFETPNLDVGTHPINSAYVEQNYYIFTEDYIVSIDGTATYIIEPKYMPLVDIYTINHSVVDYTYSDDLVPNYTDFLTITTEYFTASAEFENKITSAGLQNVIIRFAPTGSNVLLLESDNSYITLQANILPMELSLSPIFNDTTFTYDGTLKSIEVLNLPEYIFVSYESLQNDKKAETINAGEYKIKATLSCSSLYTIITDTELYATLTILKQTIDLDEYLKSVQNQQVTYDSKPHTIYTNTESLPEGVSIANETFESFVNVGDYQIELQFDFDTTNYICKSSETIYFKIIAKNVKVTLENSKFNYTGESITLVPVISGLESGDKVEVLLSSSELVNAGDHSAFILGLTSTNYKTTTQILNYTIAKASVDISGFSFENSTAIYDGEYHSPKLTTSPLPSEVGFALSSSGIKNVGKQNVTLRFTQEKSNYILPNSMTATITVMPKELTLNFSIKDAVADGSKHTPDIELIGLISGDEIKLNIDYSAEPILAGHYTCTITIGGTSNYILSGNTTFNYDILKPKSNITLNDTVFVAEGMFMPEEELKVSEIAAENIGTLYGDVIASYKLSIENLAKYPTTISILCNNPNIKLINLTTKTLIPFSVVDGYIVFAMSDSTLSIAITTGATATAENNINILPLILSLVSATIITAVFMIVITKIKKKKINKI